MKENQDVSDPVLLNRTQEALRASEARYRRLTERISAVVFELDLQGTILFVNDAVAQITGYRSDELLGRNCRDFLAADLLPAQIDALYRQLQAGDISGCELTVIGKDGRPVLLEVNSANHYRDDGALERIVGIGIDCTRRKQAEQALRRAQDELDLQVQQRTEELRSVAENLHLQNEALYQVEEQLRTQNEELSATRAAAESVQQHYRELFDYAPDGYLVTDPGGLVQEANQAAVELLGVRQDHLVGKPLLLFVRQEDRHALTTRLGWLCKGMEVRRWEARFLRQQASPCPVMVAIAPVRDAQDRLAGVRWLLHDIGERVHAEEMLRESEARFRGLVEQSSDGIVLVDELGMVVEWNHGQERITGFQHDEVLGRPIWDVETKMAPEEERTPERVGQLRESILESLRTGQMPGTDFSLEREIRRADGARRTLQSVIFPVKTGKGFMLAGISRDVTERNVIERALRRERNLLGRLMETSPAGIIMASCEGQLIFANDRAGQVLGLPKEEILVRSYNAPGWHITDERGQPFPDEALPFRQVMASGRPVYGVRHAVERPDGQQVLLSINAAPLLDDAGAVEAVVTSLEDITEFILSRRQVEDLAATLQRERDTLQEIMENTHAQLAYLDSQFNFLRVNAGYVRASGYTRDELLGHNHFAFFPNAENEAIFRRVLEMGEPIRFLAKPFEYADQPGRGVTYWDWSLAPVKDAAGRVQGLVLSLLDVTEHQRLFQEVQTTATELEVMNSRLSEALSESQRRRAEIAALLESSRAILQHRDLTTATRVIYDSCKTLIGASAGYVALLSEDGTGNNLVFMDRGDYPCTVNPSLPMPTRGLRAAAYWQAKTVYDNDFAHSAWVQFLPPGHSTVENVLFAPLVIEGKTLGLLGLSNKPGGFDENDAHLALAFAELAAIALRNSRAESEIESLARFPAESPRPVLRLGADGAVLYSNAAGQALLAAWGCALHDPAPSFWRELIAEVLTAGSSRVLDATYQGRVWVFDVVPIPGGGYVNLYARDITERRRAEEALRRSERHFREVLENVRLIAVTLDAQGNLTFCNDFLLELTGWQREEIIGRNWFDTFIPAEEGIADIFRASLAQRTIVSHMENHIFTRQGERRLILWNNTVARDLQGNVVGTTSIGEDITERKQAEEVLRRAHDELEIRVQERTAELAALYTITAAASSSLETWEVLAAVKKLLAERPDALGGLIYSYSRAADRLVLEADWGLPPAVTDPLKSLPAGALRDPSSAWVETPIYGQSYRRAVPFAGLDLGVALQDDPACLFVPLVTKGELQGALCLFRTPLSVFGEEQIAFFASLARQVAVAIQNARLYEQVRLGRERLQALSRRLVETQESERRAVARELHDEIGQTLTGLKYTLELGRRLSSQAAAAPLGEAQTRLDELIKRVRQMSLDLRPGLLDDMGLLPTLVWYLDRYKAQTNIRLDFRHTGLERRFAPSIEIAAYRVVQEALTNVARHAGVTEAAIYLWVQHEALCVRIEDRGVGFDPEAAMSAGVSSGLAGMRERVALLGGRLTVEASPGAGTCLTVELPLDSHDPDNHWAFTPPDQGRTEQ